MLPGRPSEVCQTSIRYSAEEVPASAESAVLTGANPGIKTPAFYRTRVQKAYADPVMALVMLMGGRIAVASTPGVGSVFSVTLPSA